MAPCGACRPPYLPLRVGAHPTHPLRARARACLTDHEVRALERGQLVGGGDPAQHGIALGLVDPPLVHTALQVLGGEGHRFLKLSGGGVKEQHGRLSLLGGHDGDASSHLPRTHHTNAAHWAAAAAATARCRRAKAASRRGTGPTRGQQRRSARSACEH
jgi:hypothetical protein